MTPAKVSPELPAQLPRSDDPRVELAAAALEVGDVDAAQAALVQLGESAAPDIACLRARLLASQGDQVAAVRELEQALKRWPDQSALYATAAEIHSAAGRFESAQDEIRAGLAIAGPTPDLSRARGVLMLLQPGGAKAGLGHLLEARRADPDLRFCREALTEAHRLLATQALGKQDAAEALSHARAGLALEPEHPDLALLCADALIALRQYDEGLAAYEDIARGGRDLGASLRLCYQKGGTAALLEKRPEIAIQRFIRARQLGASDAELGFGAQVLQRAVTTAQAAADKAFEEERFADARAELEALLAIDPQDLAAKNQLGVICYKLRDFDGACTAWRAVLQLAEERQVKLPEPVHLNLARALYADAKFPELRALLEKYLANEPTGEWAAMTREMLERLGG